MTKPDVAAAELGQAASAGRSGRLLRVAWFVLLAVVLAAGAWAAWLLVGTNQLARSNARAAIEAHQAACSTDVEDASAGAVVGLLSFPSQSDESWPIMAGVSAEDLSTGVGWYPQTARPGEIGNMVVAGYRITNGAPFANLLDLAVGDPVQITTCGDVYTYVIEVAPRDLTVQAGDGWVLDAVPGQPGQRPIGRMITLITSQDMLPTGDRSVGFGRLVR